MLDFLFISDGKNITRYVLQESNLKLLELEQKDTANYICEVSSLNGPVIAAKARLTVTSKASYSA